MVAPEIWRFSYQLADRLAVPRLPPPHQRHASCRKSWSAPPSVRDNFDAATLRIFSDNLAEPDRARACVQMYRTFLLREQPEIIRGRYARAAPHRPDPAPPRHRRLRPAPEDAGRLAAPRRRHAARAGRGLSATSSPTRPPTWSPTARSRLLQSGRPDQVAPFGERRLRRLRRAACSRSGVPSARPVAHLLRRLRVDVPTARPVLVAPAGRVERVAGWAGPCGRRR